MRDKATAMSGGRMSRLKGRCHCGNISFSLTWPGEPWQVPPRACGCSFCTRHGAAYVSHPEAALEVSIADPKITSRYRFGTGTAEFLICARCGVVGMALSEIDGRTYAVVNVHALEHPEGWEEAVASCFDGETVSSRLERRRQNWIGHVSIGVAGQS